MYKYKFALLIQANGMDKSIWNEFEEKSARDSLREDIETDVLVIGGGLAGILTAYYLQNSGREVTVVEACKVGGGITMNTTAVITAQHDTPYCELIKMHGIKKAKGYLDANLEAVEEYKRLSKEIDCDFRISPSVMYSEENSLEEEIAALARLGYRAGNDKGIELPFEARGAVRFDDMAEFNQMKFINAIAEKLNIYENTFIRDIKDNTAYGEKYKIRFNQAVVATHFPFINRHGLFFIKMHQRRSYVMALENAETINATYIDDKEEGFYFRSYNGLLLVGKGEHRTGCKTGALNELKAFKNRYYPDSDIKAVWANQDCVTLDGIPYIGKYGSLDNVYVATGFNLWGMTSSMVAARLLTDMLSDKPSEYAEVFSPKRSILRAQLFKNLGATLANMLIPTVRRCPHLGCALKYNKAEHSWDCSCHGSRFDDKGNFIDNPAKKNAKV